MPNLAKKTPIYHITDIENLAGIYQSGGLLSDVALARAAQRPAAVIGHSNIKKRRMEVLKVDCCDDRLVGEFVPFYYCPRSPMLYTVNKGSTGRDPGCQRTIVHLVSTVGDAIDDSGQWAISDGNAGAFHTSFYSDPAALSELDWTAIEARYWTTCTHEKCAELLVSDFFPLKKINSIGCYDAKAKAKVEEVILNWKYRPTVSIQSNWYY